MLTRRRLLLAACGAALLPLTGEAKAAKKRRPRPDSCAGLPMTLRQGGFGRQRWTFRLDRGELCAPRGAFAGGSRRVRAVGTNIVTGSCTTALSGDGEPVALPAGPFDVTFTSAGALVVHSYERGTYQIDARLTLV